MKSVKLLLVIILSAVLVTGCGKSTGPSQAPLDPQSPAASAASEDLNPAGNRVLWGLWKISISDNGQVDILPDRTGALHLNAVRLLEVAPCTTCLRIENLQFLPDDELQVDLKLRHPFPGMLKLTGFDVRGIFISGAGYTFPASGRSIAWGPDIPRMLNPDGYTALFNPTDYPETIPPALGYIPGLKATGGDLSATLNPYVAYEQDKPRCMFEPGAVSSRTIKIYVPELPFDFGYAVDACWQLVDEVIDPIEDFPPDANCTEAYKISAHVGEGLEVYNCGEAEVFVEVFDHQGFDTIESVTVEAPDFFTGEVALNLSAATGDDSWLFSGWIYNLTGAGGDEYPILVKVADTWTDENLGIVDAWQVVSVQVDEINGWARVWGGEGSDSSKTVWVDSNQDIYVTGYYSSTVDFDPCHGEDIRSSFYDSWDIFLTKFNPTGMQIFTLTWSDMPAPGKAIGWAVTTDNTGNLYITGEFVSKMDFDPGPGEYILATNGGPPDAFLMKLDPSGNFLWARSWGGHISDRSLAIVLDDQANIYVTGHFEEDCDFDPGPGSEIYISNGDYDIFLTKFDSSGTFQWARTWGGVDAEYCHGVDVDNSDYIYVPGYFREEVDFDPGIGVDIHTSNGEWDAFISSFDSTGAYRWARTFGGPYGDDADVVVATESTDILVAGTFTGTVDLDPGPGTDFHGICCGNSYVSKFDQSGEFLWALSWAASGLEDMALDPFENILLVGGFYTLLDADPGPGVSNIQSNGGRDIYLTKLDSTGNFIWVRTWGGDGYEFGRGVATDAESNIFVTGSWKETVDFYPGPGVLEYTTKGMSSDSFLIKFPPDGNW